MSSDPHTLPETCPPPPTTRAKRLGWWLALGLMITVAAFALVRLIDFNRLRSPRIYDAAIPAGSLESLAPLSAEQIPELVRRSKRPFTILNIWATWCPPCETEMPIFAKLSRLPSRSWGLILISADDESSRADAMAFLKRTGIDFPSYRVAGTATDFVRTLDPAWSGGLPLTLILDAEGKILAKRVGATTEKELLGKLKEFGVGGAVTD